MSNSLKKLIQKLILISSSFLVFGADLYTMQEAASDANCESSGNLRKWKCGELRGGSGRGREDYERMCLLEAVRSRDLQLGAKGLDNIRRYIEMNPSMLEVKDCLGWTPLCWAAYKGDTDVAELLVSAGARVDARTNTRATALHLAANGWHCEVVRLLLKSNADTKLEDAEGKTPTALVDESKNEEMVRLFSEHQSANASCIVL